MANTESKHLQRFRSKLGSGENVCRVFIAAQGTGIVEGRLILTNKRLCYYRAGLLGEAMESMPLSKISSVEYKSFGRSRYLKFYTSNDKLEVLIPPSEGKGQVEEFQKDLDLLRSGNSMPISTTAELSIASKIRECSELHAQGLLTDEEFRVKKAQLLDRM